MFSFNVDLVIVVKQLSILLLVADSLDKRIATVFSALSFFNCKILKLLICYKYQKTLMPFFSGDL